MSSKQNEKEIERPKTLNFFRSPRIHNFHLYYEELVRKEAVAAAENGGASASALPSSSGSFLLDAGRRSELAPAVRRDNRGPASGSTAEWTDGVHQPEGYSLPGSDPNNGSLSGAECHPVAPSPPPHLRLYQRRAAKAPTFNDWCAARNKPQQQLEAEFPSDPVELPDISNEKLFNDLDEAEDHRNKRERENEEAVQLGLAILRMYEL